MNSFKFFKKLVFIFVMLVIASSVCAADIVKFKAEICNDFDPAEYLNSVIEIEPMFDVLYHELDIPADSRIKVKVIYSQDEKRFHKSGFFRFCIVGYNKGDSYIDCSDSNIVGIAKRYDQIDKKEAAKTGAELTTTTVAGFMLPGIDIAYYFIKGAIQNEKAETRFKSGVHNAYDNSIFWFFQKGKPINLKKGDWLSVILSVDNTKNPDNSDGNFVNSAEN